MKRSILLLCSLMLGVVAVAQTPQSPQSPQTPQLPQMYYGDNTRTAKPFSKDPHVVRFKGRYLMYYTLAKGKTPPQNVLGIGIAESYDLISWRKVGEITPAPDAEYEHKGIAAPGALVRDGKVHLFYQTYGNRERDAICHAVSEDGINFERNPTNPIFSPTGEWNCGRAIDAEVAYFKGQYFLYFATRDKDYNIQMQGVATAPAKTNFNRDEWRQACDEPILKPELAWEKKCIEAASIIRRRGRLVMFYAGAYNNQPQQIGVAVSRDGVHWQRLSDEPFLTAGAEGEWNENESGHPHIFLDDDGRTYLFYQGNSLAGGWRISNVEVFWKGWRPYLKK